MEVYIGSTKLSLVMGDITEQDTQAIVNAANQGLWGGSGVDGAIHRAGGPSIAEECARIREETGGCPTGEAVLTGGGSLKADYVIHTVGPVWSGGQQGEDALLGNAYYNSLRLAHEKGITTVSFPSISTGAYRFPLEQAARIALTTVIECLETWPVFLEVRFVLFRSRDLDVYKKTLEGLLEGRDSTS
jgi:O-acetyl-ADP-ribose deacetylase (regulator of RNase III)